MTSILGLGSLHLIQRYLKQASDNSMNWNNNASVYNDDGKLVKKMINKTESYDRSVGTPSTNTDFTSSSSILTSALKSSDATISFMDDSSSYLTDDDEETDKEVIPFGLEGLINLSTVVVRAYISKKNAVESSFSPEIVRYDILDGSVGLKSLKLDDNQILFHGAAEDEQLQEIFCKGCKGGIEASTVVRLARGSSSQKSGPFVLTCRATQPTLSICQRVRNSIKSYLATRYPQKGFEYHKSGFKVLVEDLDGNTIGSMTVESYTAFKCKWTRFIIRDENNSRVMTIDYPPESQDMEPSFPEDTSDYPPRCQFNLLNAERTIKLGKLTTESGAIRCPCMVLPPNVRPGVPVWYVGRYLTFHFLRRISVKHKALVIASGLLIEMLLGGFN